MRSTRGKQTKNNVTKKRHKEIEIETTIMTRKHIQFKDVYMGIT